MITIGPWWLYDLIIVAVAAFIIASGIRSGLFVGLYFFIFALLMYLILTFIPQMLANLFSPLLVKELHKIGLYNALSNSLSGLDGIIGNGFKSVLTNYGFDIDLSFGNFTEDLVTSFLSLIIYLIFFLGLLSFLFSLMMIIYFFIKRRLINAAINKYVSSLCGAVFGCFIAIIFASLAAFIFSLPIFDYSSQKFGLPIKKTEDENDKKQTFQELIKSKNQFSKYAISSQFNTFLPYSAVTFSYATSCGYKYIVTPLISAIVSIKDKNNNESDKDKMADIFGIFSNTFLEGYASDNIFDLPVKQAIQVLPTESQPVVRLISELVLDSGSINYVSNFASEINNNDEQLRRGQAGVMFDQMDEYMSEHGMKEKGQKFNRSRFIDFFNETKSKGENQFIKSINYLKEKDSIKGYESLEKIFSDGDSTYNFLENVYEVNSSTVSLSTIPNLISVFTSLYLMPGLDIVPSGLASAIFGQTFDSEGTKRDYNFKIRDYMEFIDEQ